MLKYNILPSILTCLILLSFSLLSFSQDINTDGYNVFYYPNGNISSEGYMHNGKPDGYWKNYYENGNLKSEGVRKDYKLDSIWNFYYPSGIVEKAIRYRNDKKNGYSLCFSLVYKKDSIYHLTSKELFVGGLRQGESYYYYSEGNTHFTFYYRNNLKHGSGKEFSKDSTIITLFEYFNGYQIDKKKINRRDAKNRKQGTWITYHSNGNENTECGYLNDKRHGYYREYDPYGALISEKRYLHGELVTREIEETFEVKADIKTTYWSNGKIQFTGAFLEGIPVGIHKEYKNNGELELAKVYNEFGILTEQGLVNENGKRVGSWKFFYPNGELLAKGEYGNDKKQGKWEYFYKNNKKEQIGRYKNGKPEGTWFWYYPNGDILREENYLNGKREGHFVEYDNEETIITQGEYFDDVKNGNWYYNVGDHSEIGEYNFGLKTKHWIHYYQDKTISFEGDYHEDDPTGKHYYYYPDGGRRFVGKYKGGKKHNKWRKYNLDGSLFATYKYNFGICIEIDGKKIKEEDLIP